MAPRLTADLLLIDRLRRLAGSVPGLRLPSLHELACTHGCGTRAISRALYQLRDEGVVHFSKGKRPIVVANLPNPSSLRKKSASENLYLYLKRQIAEGSLKAGASLPKVSYLTSSRHVSNHTVTEAYNRLTRESLAQRVGKTFIVGRQQVPDVRSGSPPVVLIIGQSQKTWKMFGMGDRSGDYIGGIIHESERMGLQLMHAVLAVTRERHVVNYRARGLLQIRKLLDSVGMRHRGTVLLTRTLDMNAVREIMDFLTKDGKPAVWFGTTHPHSDGPRGACRQRASFCRIEDGALERVALNYLVEHGHRTILYPYDSEYISDASWQKDRGTVLCEMSNQRSRPVNILARPSTRFRSCESHFDETLFDDLEKVVSLGRRDLLEALRVFSDNRDELLDKYGAKLPHDLRNRKYAEFVCVQMARDQGNFSLEGALGTANYLLDAAVSLLPVLTGEVSALLSPNDTFYMFILAPWLAALDVKVPDDISILSFDNRYHNTFVPLSSIDWGYRDMAYRSLHAILQDIPVERTRQGVINARPYIVDGGSMRT